jgi:hypothetical protein
LAEEAVVPAPNVSAEPDPMLGTPYAINDVPHQEGEDMFLSEEWLGGVTAPADETDDRTRVELYDSSNQGHEALSRRVLRWYLSAETYVQARSTTPMSVALALEPERARRG